jgi:Fe-S cluster assembly iron-binding protein IscA
MLPSKEKYKIDLTNAAFEQAYLIKENDYTLEGYELHLKIDGKGCDGFDYAVGFTEVKADDIELKFNSHGRLLKLYMDPVTAHYCNEGTLDFLIDPKNNQDGFIFINNNQDKYVGKFFKDESMVPSHLEN